MKNFICLLALFPFVGLAQLPTDSPDYQAMVEEEKSVVAAYAKVLDAVVCLEGIVEGGAASGSGTIVSKDGLILTAAHVVSGAEDVFVNTVDGRSVPAKVLGCNFSRDVAMVKIEAEEGAAAVEWPFVELGNSKEWKAAQTYIALGHAGGYDIKRPPPIRIGWSYNNSGDDFIVTDCAVIGGDSGGPLLDLEGKLVGIHSFIGAGLSENNHAPIHAVQEDWDRLLNGEQWGKFPNIGLGLDDQKPLAKDSSDRFKKGPGGKGNKSFANIDQDTFYRFMEMKFRELIEQGEDPEQVLEDPMKLLRQYGVPRKELRRLRGPEVEKFFMEVMGEDGPMPFSEEALKGLKIPEGLDLDGFGDDILKILQTAELDFSKAADLMTKHGAKEADVKALGEDGLNDMVLQMLGLPLPTPEEKAIQKTLQEQMEICYAGHRPSLATAFKSTVALFDRGRLLCHGVVVDGRGFVLTKFSEIKRAKRLSVQLHVADGGAIVYSATNVKHWPDHDLALVFVDVKGLQAIQWSPDLPPLGSYLSTSDYVDSQVIGVGLLSVGPRSLSSENRPFLGIAFALGDGVLVEEVIKGSSAEKAGLKVDDIITKLDGADPGNVAQFIREISRKKVGDTVQLSVQRDGEAQEFEVVLGNRDEVVEEGDEREGDDARFDLMNQMSGEMSKVRTGFPLVIQTDLPIEPNQMGGALVDLKGKVVGLNIARAGRIESYAIPARTILELLSAVDFPALAKQAREPEPQPVEK